MLNICHYNLIQNVSLSFFSESLCKSLKLGNCKAWYAREWSGNKQYQVLPLLYKDIKVGKISRDDLADYLVSEAVLKENLHQFVTLT